MQDFPFTPSGPSQKVTATTASGPLTLAQAWVTPHGGSIRLANLGANDVFVNWGTAGVTADSSTGFLLMSRTDRVIWLPPTVTTLAVIAVAATSDVYVTQGTYGS